MTLACLAALSVLPPALFSAAEQLQKTPMLLTAMVNLCLAAAYLALWKSARDYRAFRSLGLFFVLVTLQQVCLYLGVQTPVWSMRALASGFLVETAADAMGLERHRWTQLFADFGFLADWSIYISNPVLAVLVVQGLRRRNPRDRSIAAAFLLYICLRVTLTPIGRRLFHVGEYFTVAGWRWWYTTTGVSLLGIVTLAIFVRDLIRDRAEKQRLAAELAASRAVQQVLIPSQIPAIPGFTLQSVYRPFGEVGGDFFQILPLPGSGALIAVGDGSGKGVPAAMLVSLIVGALHALARTETSPALLLSALNQSVRPHSNGGFTTCLILRLLAGGQATLASAGHLAPYLDGKELPLDNGLPLGLVSQAAYTETTLTLPPNRQLTLLTDGVLEAQSPTGELFGFERTAALSTQPAEEIARAAQAFGQEDDITVLTLTLHPV